MIRPNQAICEICRKAIGTLQSCSPWCEKTDKETTEQTIEKRSTTTNKPLKNFKK